MSPHNYADCIGNYCNAILIITGRSLLAQFGLTPKSKRGLAASDPAVRVSCQRSLMNWSTNAE
jgi:hypothetical protein